MYSKRLHRALADYLGLGLALIVLIAFFATTTDYFFTLITFRTIANQIPDAVIIATGMTFVLIIAGIDLSVGSVLALGGAVFGLAITSWHFPLFLAAVLCIAVGMICGAVNGVMVAKWRLPAFIVTLGMLEAARGGAYLVTTSKTHYIGTSVEWITARGMMGLSVSFLIALFIVIIAQFILSYTIFGRSMFALGGNEEAARLSGIPINYIKTAVYTLCGGLAALAAVIHCAKLTAADPNAGIGYELQAIAAVVIGGTSLMGGRGSVINTFIGVIIIAVLENGLVQMGAQDPIKRLVTGAVIIIAVVLDYYRRRP
ncbi:MAG: ABC transporter permease [Candidatus Hydrogenedentes bacterium]|nr:ABC transporter permease [Candidatus Hydrogenedentota bacterium]